jgi:hypothetical protein
MQVTSKFPVSSLCETWSQRVGQRGLLKMSLAISSMVLAINV